MGCFCQGQFASKLVVMCLTYLKSNIHIFQDTCIIRNTFRHAHVTKKAGLSRFEYLLLTAARTPVMTTNFTIVYVTEDQPAGNCLYSFNVRMWESISSFRNAIRSTCGELETGSISIENMELSPLAFQVSYICTNLQRSNF